MPDQPPVEVAVETETADCRNCGQPIFMLADEAWLHQSSDPVRLCPGISNGPPRTSAAPNHSTRRDAVVHIQLPPDAVRAAVGNALAKHTRP